MKNNETTKKVSKKILWFIFSFILLEILIVFAFVSFNTLIEFKESFSVDILLEQVTYTFIHLNTFVKSNWEEKNVLLIGGTILSFFYAIYISFINKSKKSGWETEDSNTYHGSAHWARPNEIFDSKNFLNKSKRKVLNTFEESLRKGKEQ